MAAVLSLAGPWRVRPLLDGVPDGPWALCELPGGAFPRPEADKEPLREREWQLLRGWQFEKKILLPKEPEEGKSDNYYLELSGLLAPVQVRLNGHAAGEMMPRDGFARLDITAHVAEEEENLIELTFAAGAFLGAARALYGAARQSEFVCPGVYGAVQLRKTAGALLGALHVALDAKHARWSAAVLANCRGKYVCKLRLMDEAGLLFGQNKQISLRAAENPISFCEELPRAPQGAVQAVVTLTRGGIACDSVQQSVLPEAPAERLIAWQPPEPVLGVLAPARLQTLLRTLRSVGADAVLVRGYVTSALAQACAEAGMRLATSAPEAAVCRNIQEAFAARRRGQPLLWEKGVSPCGGIFDQNFLPTPVFYDMAQALSPRAICLCREGDRVLCEYFGAPEDSAVFVEVRALGETGAVLSVISRTLRSDRDREVGVLSIPEGTAYVSAAACEGTQEVAHAYLCIEGQETMLTPETGAQGVYATNDTGKAQVCCVPPGLAVRAGKRLLLPWQRLWLDKPAKGEPYAV